jgi:prepilin-type processing-associated H-X9-DG protein
VDPGFSNGSGHSGVPNLAVNGPWLTGTHGQNTALNGPWRTYGKLSQMVAPVPSKLWVMTEESPLSVNDGVMAMSVGRTLWVDYPSTLHSFGGVLAFADGHSELHQWMDPSTRLNGFPSGGVLSTETNDWSWLAVRTRRDCINTEHLTAVGVAAGRFLGAEREVLVAVTEMVVGQPSPATIFIWKEQINR